MRLDWFPCNSTSPLTTISSQIHIFGSSKFPPIELSWCWILLRKITLEFYDLSKTWFNGESDLLVDKELQVPSADSASSNEGAPNHPNKGELLSSNEGAKPLSSLQVVSQSQSSDDSVLGWPLPNSNRNAHLEIPVMMTMNTVGLLQSPCLAARNQNANSMSLTSILTNICAFSVMLAYFFLLSQAVYTGPASLNITISISNFNGTTN